MLGHSLRTVQAIEKGMNGMDTAPIRSRPPGGTARAPVLAPLWPRIHPAP